MKKMDLKTKVYMFVGSIIMFYLIFLGIFYYIKPEFMRTIDSVSKNREDAKLDNTKYIGYSILISIATGILGILYVNL